MYKDKYICFYVSGRLSCLAQGLSFGNRYLSYINRGWKNEIGVIFIILRTYVGKTTGGYWKVLGGTGGYWWVLMVDSTVDRRTPPSPSPLTHVQKVVEIRHRSFWSSFTTTKSQPIGPTFRPIILTSSSSSHCSLQNSWDDSYPEIDINKNRH